MGTAQQQRKGTRTKKDASHQVELIDPKRLVPHPRNYRAHPDEQIEHLKASLRSHRFYRNIVAARDLTILAGHGIVKAALALGLKHVPVVRLALAPDSPRALKLLVADNELARLAEEDQPKLVALLAALDNDSLLGTGYDSSMIALLKMVVRPSNTIDEFDPFGEWEGMPDYDPGTEALTMLIEFPSAAARDAFVSKHDLTPETRGKVLGCWWPHREDEDLSSVRWE